MATTIKLVRNDTRPAFGGSVDFDLSGYVIELHVGFPTTLIKTATILTATETSSTFEFAFVDGDLAAPVGQYFFEIEFNDGNGGILTYQEDECGRRLKLKLVEEIA